MAAHQPDKAAVKIPRGRTSTDDIDYLVLSFAELDAETDSWVGHLQRKGVQRGDRVLVMVRQGLPLIAAAFALFKLGAVPVIIDPGMERKNFLACVARSKPRVLLGIPFAQLMSYVFRSAFASIGLRVWVSGSPTACLKSSQPEIENQKSKIVNSDAADLAAVLFTSGSTGAPKGVCYEHGMFDAQIRLIRETYGIEPGEVDLPMLPIFALFNPALGMTTIVPELDPSRPAMVDPEKIVRAILQEKTTNSFGSPTLWRKIFDHCLARGITLPSLRRVLCAGAAVPLQLYLDSQKVLSKGALHSPYGATEALPISTTHTFEALAKEILNQTEAYGVCIGKPITGIEVRIIAISDEPIATLADTRGLPCGEIGEIIVRGPVVTKCYDGLIDETAAAKIRDGNSVWHRMGDCGRLDSTGRLWFCGRKAERVVTQAGTLYTEPCEQVFRSNYPGLRVALIGLGPKGQMLPALVVESTELSKTPLLVKTLLWIAKSRPNTAEITRFYFHPKFPVDVRHNAKIHRLALARWAATAKATVPGKE
jgi:acyl-CoA synthetase (AMP-forming)/AMP-acid ligase II